MIKVGTLDDILKIINNASLYLCCEQTNDIIMTILTNENITDENRIKFYETLRETQQSM